MADVRPDTMERITTEALAEAFIDEQIAAIKAQVGNKRVLLALSGGVDSSVVAALLIKAIGKNLVCVHVNHGPVLLNRNANARSSVKNSSAFLKRKPASWKASNSLPRARSIRIFWNPVR